jgi:hypothetical protein
MPLVVLVSVIVISILLTSAYPALVLIINFGQPIGHATTLLTGRPFQANGLEFLQEPLEGFGHRRLRNLQFLCDLLLSLPFPSQCKDVPFPFGQSGPLDTYLNAF